MIDIPLKAEVICTDGEAGIVSAIIINPASSAVTHIVVETRKYLDFLVPLEHITETTPDSVHLACTIDELHAMRAFTETHFVPASEYDERYMDSAQFFSPYVTADRYTGGPMEEEMVPAGELAVHRGTDVYASDGHVGVLEEFVVDPETGHVSHLVLRKGHLLGKHDVVIPISAIDHQEYDSIYLNLAKDDIATLPGVTVSRHYKGQD